MRRTRLAVALALGLLGGSRAAALADPVVIAPANAPFAMMRTLQVLQEQIAHGNAAAQAAQPKLMAHIAEVFLATEPSDWRDPRNARAAALFLLSGGRPSVIREVLTRTTMPAEIDTLLKGALAYAEGQDEVARALLGTIDPRTLPTTLGGHLALVEATLLSDRDDAKAEKLLDLARLLVPGTLVEEAALRRQIFLLADTTTLDKFVALSRQYVRRFRKSIYAENFRQRFTAAATSLALRGDVAQMSKLDPVFAELSIDERRTAYLEIAKAAIVRGRTQTARFAAEKAMAIVKDRPVEGARSKLYTAAALVLTDAAPQGISILEGIDASRLGAEDAELRDAALTVGRLVRADATAGPTDGAAASDAGSSDPAVALIGQARKALADSDTILAGAAR